MEENPYKAPENDSPGRNPRWLRVVLRLNAGVFFLFALLFGIIGLIWAAASWRWLRIEAAGGGGDELSIYGFGFSMGQVLLLGSASALGLALALVYVGLRIIRPPATQD